MGRPTADSDREYTQDQIEFLKAIDRYKRERLCPHPAWSQVFLVLTGLGYRKENPGTMESEQQEFTTEMELYRKKHPFPHWSAVLKIFLDLGYRKVS